MKKPQLYTQVKGPTRRGFMAQTAALGAVGASGGLGLWPGRARANTPVMGGHFNVALSGSATTDTLNPRLAQNEIVYGTLYNIHAYLIDVGPRNELIPEIASSWTPDPDTSRWVFDLNPDAKFHNGQPVTSEDVIASIAFHMAEDSESGVKGQLEIISEMTADGPNRVVMQLARRNADFPYLFSAYQLAILPASEGGVDWQSGIGAGAYMLESFEPGTGVRMSRNPEMWLPDRGFVDTIEITAVNDPSARVQALLSGSADIITKVDFRLADRISGVPGVKLITNGLRAHYSWPMLTDTAPFDDNNIRLAMKYAFDREAFIERILGGFGTLGNDNPIAPSHQYFNTELEQRQYDPERARFHLREAGLETITVPLSTSEAAYSGAVDSAVLFAETARPAGIEVEITREPADGYWSEVWGQKPFINSYWGGRPTEDSILSLIYSSQSGWNDTRFNNARLDEIIVEAQGEADTDRRRELYWEAQAIIHNEGGALIPAYIQAVDGAAEEVQHPEEMSGVFELDGMRGLQRWWIDES